MAWKKTRLLILGMTYPSYSRKYKELACTGALIADTWEMIRIHPVPWRYINASERFHAWDWIEAHIERDESDPRPESYRIDPDSIVLCKNRGKQERMENGPHRINVLRLSPSFFPSYGALREAATERSASLGAIELHKLISVTTRPKTREKRQQWDERRAEVLAQPEMFLKDRDALYGLDFIPVRFVVNWEDRDGDDHHMTLHEWGVQQMYRHRCRQTGHEEAVEYVRRHIERELDLRERAIYFFLGTFRERQHYTRPQFGLLSVLRCNRDKLQQGTFSF